MSQLAFTFLFAGALVLYSCGSSGEETTKKVSADSSKADTSMTANDTLNQKTAVTDTIPDEPEIAGPPIAPGTLRLKGKIIDIHQIEKDSSTTYYDIKALKILGIGSSTPAIVLNDTLQISSVRQLKNVTKDAELICTIQYQQGMVGQNDTSPQWQLMQWERNPDQQ